MWASRAIILFGLFFALILNLYPLFTWASRAILNSYACFLSSLKPPFTFTSPTVRLVVAPPCLSFCFYSFAYLPLDCTGSPAGASLFCLLYLILFVFTSWYVHHTMRYSDGWVSLHSRKQLIYALNPH